ncbi:PA domain-containing protein [Pseudoxanthomonas dokdonensis]|uniref:PA domain-containing protein n=1 Tax=Pseudoxanthomonas dokdonensis TaxID=344882 RepID=A0A0R0CR33_9GAMM|nr:PA domain-containing protein [Pseudoxanthomonas dokdonensis]KRG68334.1 hypothetical protein ABB29_13525 [Pseudoxanthomonas dokdonensis]
MNKSFLIPGALAAAIALASAAPAHGAELILVSGDVGTGTGLEDPSPRTPIGLNPGTTLGEQRTLVYEFAMQMWGAVLESQVPVYIGASFQALPCTATGAVLGSAGTTNVFADFAPGIAADTWYPSALADAIAGSELNPDTIDINSRFNSNLGQPNCLAGSEWYYGLDGKAPAGTINFLNVVMHEIGHGLGMQGLASSDGSLYGDMNNIYANHAYNNTLGKAFPDMDDAERAQALVDNGNTVWIGQQVNQQAALVLDNLTSLLVSAPAAAAGGYEMGTASFGVVANDSSFNGSIVAAVDGGTSGSDGCEAISNPDEIAGNIALVDRGNCTFASKAVNVQAAGATGVIVVNTADAVQGMGGIDPSVTIPAILVAKSTGDLLRANLPAQATVGKDPNRLQGADSEGRVRLYAPNPYESGSSFSHFDEALQPSALMEPRATAGLQSQVNVDLTPALYQDLGWSINPGNALVGDCDTGVDVFEEGGLVAGANVQAWNALCATTQPDSRRYQRCMASYVKQAQQAGVLDRNSGNKVLRCVTNKR